MESDMAELGSWHQGKVTKIEKYQLDYIDGEAVCGDGRFLNNPHVTSWLLIVEQELFGKLTARLTHWILGRLKSQLLETKNKTEHQFNFVPLLMQCSSSCLPKSFFFLWFLLLSQFSGILVITIISWVRVWEFWLPRPQEPKLSISCFCRRAVPRMIMGGPFSPWSFSNLYITVGNSAVKMPQGCKHCSSLETSCERKTCGLDKRPCQSLFTSHDKKGFRSQIYNSWAASPLM